MFALLGPAFCGGRRRRARLRQNGKRQPVDAPTRRIYAHRNGRRSGRSFRTNSKCLTAFRACVRAVYFSVLRKRARHHYFRHHKPICTHAEYDAHTYSICETGSSETHSRVQAVQNALIYLINTGACVRSVCAVLLSVFVRVVFVLFSLSASATSAASQATATSME